MSDILVKILPNTPVTNGSGDGLAVYGLGSTVAVILYDETTKVGGCLQFMLPASISSPQRARNIRRHVCRYRDRLALEVVPRGGGA